MKDIAYTYTVLRYVHDVATAEFVNVGVVLVAPGTGFVGVRFRQHPGRLADMFSDFNRAHFRKRITSLEKRFGDIRTSSLFHMEQDARRVAESVLPQDDSAYQWSPLGSGVAPAHKLGEEVDSCFQQLVVHHEKHRTQPSRTDEQVWRGFRSFFGESGRSPDARRLAALNEKTVFANNDRVRFRKAWKNGAWHCLEPLSLDLRKQHKVSEKAHTWLGRLTSIENAEEAFKVYFLVGEPEQPSHGMKAECERAVRILQKARGEHEVIREAGHRDFAMRIAKDLPEPETADQPTEPDLFT